MTFSGMQLFPIIRSKKAVGFPGDQGRVAHDLAVEGCVIDIDAAFLHYLFRITIGYGISDVEKHGIQDHIFRIMGAFEIDHHVLRCFQINDGRTILPSHDG